MTDRLDPLAAAADIEDGYKRYLKTLLAPRVPDLATAFDEAVDRTSLLTRGPLLELTPPYQPGASLRELIAEGVLHPGFVEFAATMSLDRPLYRHQETAVRKIVAGRNLVVSTGTGSGKTESFLLPILNELIAEKAAGTLGPGVRALLLYPMNALANDQLERLRGLLAATPDITFGRYTGETPQRQSDGESSYSALRPGKMRLPNELLSRDEMRATPPHILLTNYAMLEYLLLRPRDVELFDGEYAGTWRFIALDEAHVYDGAQGSEVASLLRRLRDRVGHERRVQCVATSASLSGSTEDRQGIEATAFAQKLFDAEFEFVDGDRDRQDLVTAARMRRRDEPTWTLDDAKLLELAAPDAELGWIATNSPVGDVADALHRERHIADLTAHAAAGPVEVDDLAAKLWPGDELASRKLEALVALGSRVRDAEGHSKALVNERNPVLSARYHLFVRATEGAYVSFAEDGPRVLLSRHEIDPVTGRAVFEFGTCQRCGAVHLAGEPTTVEGRRFFRPAKRDSKVKWLVLRANAAEDVIDEDETTLSEDDESANSTGVGALCTGCGVLGVGATGCAAGCPGGPVLQVREHPTAQRVMSKCTECGARSRQVIRRLRTDVNAAPAVITTALYQNLPAADDFETAELVGGGRKLLMFSDSRQSAAFAAPYLASTYGRMLERRYLTEALHDPKNSGELLSAEDLAADARAVAERVGHFDESATRSTRLRAVHPWVMAELMSMDQRQSLEGLGLMAVSLFRSRKTEIPRGFTGLGLTGDEFWGLLEELVKSIRLQGAMTLLPEVDIKQSIFEPRNTRIYLRSMQSDRKRRIISWLPGGRPGTTNNRILLIRKVLGALAVDVPAEKVLEGCWKFLVDHGYLTVQNNSSEGVVYQLDQEKLRLGPGASATWYRCDACRRLTTHNIRGLCPQGACDGVLGEYVVPAIDLDTNHYRTAYRTLAMVPLFAQEHTAQWEATEAAVVQRRFIAGDINVLSCSTTFELGVDVGELQSVMLRNMPPKTANYVQRAGRAGRRAASAALVVTYAKRSSHDLSKFQKPESMIAGRMRIPWVPIDNVRIGRRHAHSVALAAYFRHRFDTEDEREWRYAGSFFEPDPETGESAATQVREFLTPVPPEIRESLRKVLSANVAGEIGVETDEWVETLCDLLGNAEHDIRSDIATFQGLIEDAKHADKLQLGARLQKTLKTIRDRQLLGYLANKNVLPKYGFPVDTVELRTSHCEGDIGAALELSRDLGQAIYEYAPGNQIVAGGKLWTSRGLHKLPKRELEELQYRVCKECNHFECGHVLDVAAVCPNCKQDFGAIRTCVLPEFGFDADRMPQDVRSEPPQRTRSGASYVETIGDSSGVFCWPPDGHVEVQARAGTRAKLAVISEGAGGGFRLCAWCGWAEPYTKGKGSAKAHSRPATGTACDGPLHVVSLAHRYETDVAEFTFPDFAYDKDAEPAWLSVLYALLEGASEALEISRDDIDGTLSWSAAGSRSIVLFDTVPAGAGAAKQIAEQLELVLRCAADRVQRCECGAETSCYGCLRSYRNEWFHDRLTRAGAMEVFEQLKLLGTQAPAPEDLYVGAVLASRAVRELLADLSGSGLPEPEVGIEVGRHYWPVEIAWPTAKVVVVEGDDDDRDIGLTADGFQVVRVEGMDAVSLRDMVSAAVPSVPRTR
ncbi:DEAD/DEAH box helicase [Nocardia macrotermitis]|uniref:ATP-dependent RNA helicase RhlE n=1 Tax=Nocardia macrotermitis TaxID=2585198 RepID=A0A7K0CX65_9NOCA|nr:DEAD/DEAH box helicase [Nocardia macrotermitis]MQY18089.1 ATP-dependent RNA helicase RhlE [Nocardia macrotermitis]